MATARWAEARVLATAGAVRAVIRPVLRAEARRVPVLAAAMMAGPRFGNRMRGDGSIRAEGARLSGRVAHASRNPSNDHLICAAPTVWTSRVVRPR